MNVSGGTFSALHSTFVIGDRGAGTLNISGGLVAAVQRVTVADENGSNGQVALNGGILSANQIVEGSGTGTLTFNSGTLRANGTQGDFLSGFEDGDVTINAGGAFIDSNGASIGISTALSGTGVLTKIGLGTLTLSGSNSYAGGTTVSFGALSVSGGIINHSSLGGMVRVGNLNGENGQLVITNGGWVSGYGGRVGEEAGSAGLVNVSSGTWDLADDLYVGNGGTGTVTVQSGGIVSVGSGTVVLGGAIGGSGTLNIGAGGAAGTLLASVVTGGSGAAQVNFNHTGTLAFTSQLAGGLSVAKFGAGTTVLTASNSYTGNTLLAEGTLRVGGNYALGSGTLVIDGGVLGNDAANSESRIYNNVTVNSGFGVDLLGGLGTLKLFGDMDLGAGGTRVISIVNNGYDFVLGGAVVGSSNLEIVASGPDVQTMTFSGTRTNTFAGTLTVGDRAFVRFGKTGGAKAVTGNVVVTSDGDLVMIEDDQFSATSSVLVDGTLSMATSAAQVIEELTGSGKVTGGATDNTLTINSGSFSGQIVNGPISQMQSFTKGGIGTLTLSGNSTYTGTTAVIGGKLVVDGLLSNSNVNVAGGAALGGSGTINKLVTVQDGGALAPGSSPGTLTVRGLQLSGSSILNFELSTAGVAGGGVNDYVISSEDVVLDGILNIQSLSGFGAGTYYLFNYGGSDLFDNGLMFGLAPGGFDYAIDTATSGQVNLLVAAAAGQYWDGSNTTPGSMPGGSGGDGVWNNDGANTNWTNTAGNVNSAWTGVLPAIFGGTAGTVNVDAVANVAEMRFLTDGYVLNGSGELAVSGTILTIRPDAGVGVEIQTVITGIGGVEKTGAGTVLLSGLNTYEGGTQLNAGALRIGDHDALGTGALIINGGTLGNDGVGGFPIISNNIVTNADFTIAVEDFAGGLEFEGAIALGTGTRTILLDGEGMVCFGGVIGGENLTLLSASGTSEVQFCGTGGNTFTGTLRVGNGVQVLLAKDPGAVAVAGDLVVDALGVAELGGDGQLAATSSVQVDGLLDLLFSTDVAINRLSGSGTVQGGLIGGTLAVQGGNFTGAILDGAAVQALAKTGAGTLVLSGANGFTGGTTINAGTLQTQNQFALAAGAVTLNGGSLAPVAQLDIATLTWNGGTIAAALGTTPSFVNIAGNLVLGAGGGGFVFSEGAGYLANTAYGILSAANLGTFTTANFFGNAIGGVTPTFTINGNTLLVSFIGASTGGTLSNYAPVFTPANANFFVNGQVQTSNAPNTVAALTFAAGSFLEVFNNLFVTNGSFLVNSGSATVGGSGNVITPGAFTKFGSGLLNVLTNLFVFGNATIAEGGLAVNGTLTANNLFVQLGTWLQGNGVIFGNLFNNGLAAPGNSPGTLTITGNFTQGSTGTLAVELASLTNFDRLIVGGNAALAGTLSVQSFGGFEPEYGQQFAFLQAGSISGAFDTITTWDPSVYRARFLQSGGTGSILIAPASYTLVAETTNQRNVAAALDGFIPATSGDRLTVSLALDVQSAEQYPAAFDQIAPTFYESLANITIEQANAQSQMLAQRMSAVKLGAAGFQAYGMESPLVHDIDGKSVLESKDVIPQSAIRDPQWSTWVQGNGIFAKVVNVSQVPGYRFQSGGFLFGVDYAWGSRGQEGPALTTGVFAGYQGTYAKYSGGGQNTINSALFGGYASFQNGGFYADAVVGGGYSNYNVRRPIAFSTIDRTATSKPDGGQFSTYLDAGYDWKAGGFTFGPLVSAQYTYAGIAPFTEDGAGSLNLAVDQQNVNSLRTNIGGRIAYAWNVTEKIVIVPEVRMFWQHEFLNNPRNIGASLDGGNGAGFGYETSTPDRDSVFAGAGISAQFGERWSGYVYYNADFGRQDYIGQMISTGLNWKF